MEIGEIVTELAAFTGVSSLCAFGCESGRLGIFDAENCRIVYDNKFQFPITGLTTDDEKNLYFTDTKSIYRYDMRSSDKPQNIYSSSKEILSFCLFNEQLAVSSSKEGIVLSDTRILKQPYKQDPNSSIPSCHIQFIDNENIIASYVDGSLIKWNKNSEEKIELEVNPLTKIRKMRTIGMAAYNDYLAVGYQSGFSIYKNFSLIEHTDGGQKALLKSMIYAPCFEAEYITFLTEDNIIYPYNLDTNTCAPSKPFTGTEITKISANYLMIVAADNEEEGRIAVMMPEDFSDEFF
ncbi:hypothetical protein TVAG_075310 [Trichomonas vaginalis G3]|uniref:Uncharacterized protein n=1 Tax=Trichomonas vaginalis (strain ATCC PRA-98 / G3) TaxID=412133 RepID=A2FED8_TRIV3|nr:WD40 repeat-like family [Trichomonas vaginalis G3]EAX96725.1 hypothetical protein TVAG_075310 [Trichomonas vaginalis G3]KAI5521691.1 WD40 repeat-like family [Trichomonas vaginalis G3]|eukprot:XP_001309655.1 hypothetical protein [Trichomonas vaginalis G3]